MHCVFKKMQWRKAEQMQPARKKEAVLSLILTVLRKALLGNISKDTVEKSLANATGAKAGSSIILNFECAWKGTLGKHL